MYDIAIIGAGVSGIFLAYTLLKEKPTLKILMIEAGSKFEDRICVLQNKTSDKCVSCNVCSRMQGFGGLLRSEGKFNYTNDFGGTLGDKIGYEEALKLMESVDEILCEFGGDKINLYSTENKEISKRAKENGFNILTTKVRHLGSNISYSILEKMYLHLKDSINIEFNTSIELINKYEDIFILKYKDKEFKSKKVVLATGLTGGSLFEKYCKDFNIKSYKTRVDLGLRVEMAVSQLDSLFKESFETKINYKNNEFEATTYCMNPKGKIIKKYQDKMVMADGQNYLETDIPSYNLNFTVFVPEYFSSSKEAMDYAKGIIEHINQNKERIAVQRLEDLLNNRKTTRESLNKNTIKATLKGEGADLYNEVPKVYIKATLKIFQLIESIIGEKINKDTLLYAIDGKFYQPEIYTDSFFQTEEVGLYIIGDCSGVTYSLSQAAASGIYLARNIE